MDDLTRRFQQLQRAKKNADVKLGVPQSGVHASEMVWIALFCVHVMASADKKHNQGCGQSDSSVTWHSTHSAANAVGISVVNNFPFQCVCV